MESSPATPPYPELPACPHDEAHASVPDDPYTILSAMEFITNPDRSLDRAQQHAAFAYTLRLAETPLSPDAQPVADEIIRATYENLVKSSSSRFLRFCREPLAKKYGAAMMRRDGRDDGPTPDAVKIRYFVERLYPDGEPDFPGKL